jgi:hypothetical protein
MTTRTVSIVFLFGAAMVVAAVALGLAVALGARVAWGTGAWLVPVTLFASFVTVFFIGREYVLPPTAARPARKALVVLSAWMLCTLAAATAITWAIEPMTAAVGRGSGALAILFLCLLASAAVLDRLVARTRWRPLP